MPSENEYQQIEEQGDKLFWTKAEITMWRALKVAAFVLAGAAAIGIGIGGGWLTAVALAAGGAVSLVQEKRTTEQLAVMYDAIAAKNNATYLGQEFRKNGKGQGIVQSQDQENGQWRSDDAEMEVGQSAEPAVQAHENEQGAYSQNQRARSGSYVGDVTAQSSESPAKGNSR